MIRAIIFDLDGTLINIKKAQDDACFTFYNTYGFNKKTSFEVFVKKWDKVTDKYYSLYIKRKLSYEEQRIKRVEAIFEVYGLVLPSDPKTIYENYLVWFEDSWAAYEEVPPVLEKLKGHYRLGVLTNGDKSQQIHKLRKTKLYDYFSNVVCAGEFNYAKPDTRLFEEILTQMGVSNEECLFVGDKYNTDIAPCVKLNIKNIYLLRGIKKKKVNSKITYYAEDCNGIFPILEKL